MEEMHHGRALHALYALQELLAACTTMRNCASIDAAFAAFIACQVHLSALWAQCSVAAGRIDAAQNPRPFHAAMICRRLMYMYTWDAGACGV
jgi:hypothetical protein